MSIDVSTTTVVGRPLAVVFAYAVNPENAPEWYTNIKRIEWRTPPPLAVGSLLDFVAHFMGRRMAYTYEVVELVPEKRLVMRTSQGPFPMETTYEWEPVSSTATRMTLRNRGTPSGFFSWMSPILATAVRRANRKDLALLKERLEKS